MGDILPFVARVRDAGEWTASERARLEALADQFTKAGVHVFNTQGKLLKFYPIPEDTITNCTFAVMEPPLRFRASSR